MVEESLTRQEVQTALAALLHSARKNKFRKEELVYEHCFRILAMLDEPEGDGDD